MGWKRNLVAQLSRHRQDDERRPRWTEQLGEAAAIQQLRDEAVAKDVLKQTEHVQVVNEGDNVVIKSADPQVVYVPTYPPEKLYEPDYVIPAEPIVYEHYPSYYYPTAPYWAGFVTGAGWAAVVDWDDWGTWGGDVDIDVAIGDRVDFDFDNEEQGFQQRRPQDQGPGRSSIRNGSCRTWRMVTAQ
jgi:hypothetical protein